MTTTTPRPARPHAPAGPRQPAGPPSSGVGRRCGDRPGQPGPARRAGGPGGPVDRPTVRQRKGGKARRTRRSGAEHHPGRRGVIMLSGLVVVGALLLRQRDAANQINQRSPPPSSTPTARRRWRSWRPEPHHHPGRPDPEFMKQAVVAAEDNTFYTNSGVDFKGILRAAWNNFTGVTGRALDDHQQYVRNVFDLQACRTRASCARR